MSVGNWINLAAFVFVVVVFLLLRWWDRTTMQRHLKARRAESRQADERLARAVRLRDELVAEQAEIDSDSAAVAASNAFVRSVRRLRHVHNHPPGYIGGETCDGCRADRGEPSLERVRRDWEPYR